jgi:pteridine reductase
VRVNCVLAGMLEHRQGTPEHVAHAVLFLLENEFVTGVCLPLEGGRTIA